MRNTSFLLVAFLLAGCSSLPGNVQSIVNKIPPSFRWNSLTRDVEKLLTKGDLEGARRALDEAGAGSNATPDALLDRDRSTARDQFRVKVEKHFSEQCENLWKAGKPRGALKAASTGLTICPWCSQLQALNDRSAIAIAQIDSLSNALSNAMNTKQGGGAVSLPDLRAALAKAANLERLLEDSPDVSLALSSGRQSLSEAGVTSIRSGAISLEDLRKDVLLLGATESQADDITYLLKQTPEAINSSESRQALLAALTKRSGYARDEVRRIRLAAEARTTALVVNSLVPLLQTTQPDPSYIDFAEAFIETPISGTEALRTATAKSHLSRARVLAGSGKVAVVAIAHAKRAATLDSYSTTTEKIFATAEASFSASGSEVISLHIETNPSDDPSAQEVCRRAVAFAVIEHARPHVRIQFANRYDSKSDIDIHIDSAILLVPSEASLARRTSSYLSHFENVPNPFKASLKTQLEIQKINVSTALNNYNYAISSFNIAPTEWALQNANLAQTTYNIAIDNYNELVSRYNATPSTISRPVYLPYSFKEGTVSHGWKLEGYVRVGNFRRQFSVNEVDTDFVRFGTRPEDRDVNLRRDDPLDIPVGTDRLVQQLAAAAERVYRTVAMTSQSLQVVTRSDLSKAEQEFLTQALFPFGTDATAQSSYEWVRDAIAKTTIPAH